MFQDVARDAMLGVTELGHVVLPNKQTLLCIRSQPYRHCSDGQADPRKQCGYYHPSILAEPARRFPSRTCPAAQTQLCIGNHAHQGRALFVGEKSLEVSDSVLLSAKAFAEQT